FSPRADIYFPCLMVARFFAAHRRFIRSDNFLRLAGVSRLPVCAGRATDCVGRCGLAWLRLLWPSPPICCWMSAISGTWACLWPPAWLLSPPVAVLFDATDPSVARAPIRGRRPLKKPSRTTTERCFQRRRRLCFEPPQEIPDNWG